MTIFLWRLVGQPPTMMAMNEFVVKIFGFLILSYVPEFLNEDVHFAVKARARVKARKNRGDTNNTQHLT